MSAVKKVAIAGSGVAALAAGTLLARGGVQVDVFEAKENTGALGSGISMQGNALRVLDKVGVWEQLREEGFEFEGLALRAPGPGAPIVAELPEMKTGGPQYPAGMGMFRPVLARVMLEHAQAEGVNVRFASKVTGVQESNGAVTVEVNGKTAGTYDLLIGADGLNSTVRSLIGITEAPQPTGMGIWRTVVKRPESVQRPELYYGGPVYIAGYTPTGEDTMYAFLVEKAQDRFGVTPEDAAAIMVDESAAYHGPWDDIREDLASGGGANYTWFTSHLVEGAWNRGRVVLIGDAAHSCPPTIAQGAAQALEDAMVLAELLLEAEDLSQDLWDTFHARRMPRAKRVVEASVQLGQWQINGDRDADAAGLIFSVSQQMAEPA